jgi:hypothetical protein
LDAIQQYSSPKKPSILEHLDGDSTINRYFAFKLIDGSFFDFVVLGNELFLKNFLGGIENFISSYYYL